MKAILEFGLPEDRNEHLLAINGGKWFSVAHSMENKLREYQKYGHEFKDADEAIDVMRTELNALMVEYNLTFDEEF